MIVHFSSTYRILCNGVMSRSGGALYSRYNDRDGYRQFKKDATFLFTTSDEPLTCKECIKIRIAFHEQAIAKLKSRITPESL